MEHLRAIIISAFLASSCFGQVESLSLLQQQSVNASATTSNSDLLISWDMTSLVNGQQVITNTATSGGDSCGANLINTPQNFFSSDSIPYIWNSSSFTDNWTNAPDGTLTASRCVYGAGYNHGPLFNIALSNIGYVFSLYVKSETTNQLMRCGFQSQGSDRLSPDLEVTTDWSRISFAFTNANISGIYPVVTASTSNALDIEVWGAQLEVGTSPTVYFSPTNFHARFGRTLLSDSYDPVALTNCADLYGTRYLLGYGAPMVMSNVTIYQVFRRTNTTPQSSTYLSAMGRTQDKMRLQSEGAQSYLTAGFKWGASSIYASGPWCDLLWHCAIASYDGTNLNLFLDGRPMGIQAAAIGLVTNTFTMIGSTPTTAPAGDFALLKVYGRAHSRQEVSNNWESIRSEFAAKGIGLTTLTRQLAFEGDSITAGNGSADSRYPAMTLTNLNPVCFGPMFAVSGNTIGALSNRASTVDSCLIPGGTNVLSVLIGANDLYTGSPTLTQATNFYLAVGQYTSNRLAAGWKVVLGTILPRGTPPSNFLTNRNAVNILFRANTNMYSALADYASDPVIGPDWGATNGVLFPDNLHPSTAGYTNMWPYLKAAVTNLLGVQ